MAATLFISVYAIGYHAEFGSSALKDVSINTREPLKLGSAGIPPPLRWRMAHPLNKPLPRMCYHVKFRCNQTWCGRILRVFLYIMSHISTDGEKRNHASWRLVKSVCIIHSSAPAFKNVCRNVPEVQFVTDEVPSLTSYFQSPIHITATPHDATCCRLVVDNSSRICHELVRTVAASETTDKSSATFS